MTSLVTTLPAQAVDFGPLSNARFAEPAMMVIVRLAFGLNRSYRLGLALLSENPALARELGARAQRLYREAFQPAVIVSRIRHTMLYAKQKDLVNEEAVLHG